MIMGSGYPAVPIAASAVTDGSASNLCCAHNFLRRSATGSQSSK